MNKPDEDALPNQADEDGDEDVDQERLSVEGGNSLGRRANGSEKVELTHLDFRFARGGGQIPSEGSGLEGYANTNPFWRDDWPDLAGDLRMERQIERRTKRREVCFACTARSTVMARADR